MRRPVRLLAALLLVLSAMAARAEILEAPPFRIECAEAPRADAEQAREVLLAALETYRDRLPPGDAPIEVIVCGSPRAFRQFAGDFAESLVGGIARSEEGVIVVKAPGVQQDPGAYPGVLRHELVHVLLARNVPMAHLPRWLNEGIAMRLALEHRWRTPWTIGQMYLRHDVTPYAELNLVLETAPGEIAFGNAYAQSLAMTNFLFDHLGEEAFWTMIYSLREQRFLHALDTATGWTPLELWTAWHGTLWKLALAFSLVTGLTLMQAMALLTVYAYLRTRWRDQRTIQQWQAEDEDDIHLPSDVFEPATYEWEDEDDDDERNL